MVKSKSKNASQPRVHLTFTKKQFDLLNEFVIEGEYGDKMATALQALIMETLRRRKELWAKPAIPVSAVPELVEMMRKETDNLKEAAQIGLREMTIWLELNECECDPGGDGHFCGLPRLKDSIREVKRLTELCGRKG